MRIAVRNLNMSFKKAWYPILAVIILLIAGILYIHFTHYAPLDVPEGTEVEVWYAGDDCLWQSFGSLVDSYNTGDGEKYGIKVNAREFEDRAALYDAVDAAADNNEALPDMLICDTDFAAYLYRGGRLAAISDYFGQWEISYIDDKFSDAAKCDDALVAVPVAAETGVFIINNRLYPVDENLSFEKLCAMSDDYYAETGKSFYSISDYSQFFRTAMSQYSDSFDGVSPHDTKNNNCKYVYKHLAETAYNRSFMATGDSAAKYVAGGELACAVVMSSQVMEYRHLMNDGDIAFAAYPCVENGVQVCPELVVGITMLAGSEASQNASAMFIRWFTSDEVNGDFVGESGYLSAVGAMTEDSDDAVYKALTEAIREQENGSTRLIYSADAQYSENSRSFDAFLKTIMESFA